MVPSIEGSLKTHRWAMRVFQYLLASSEVNMFLLQKHYVWGNDEQYTLLEYRRELPRALIHNSIVTDIPKGRSIDPLVVHERLKCPAFTSGWNGVCWEKNANFKYNQFTCRFKGCRKRVLTYCHCSPGYWLCESYWRKLFLDNSFVRENR